MTNPQLSKENFKEREKNWSRVPDGFPAPQQTGRLTVGSKLTSTSTSAALKSCKLFKLSSWIFPTITVIYNIFHHKRSQNKVIRKKYGIWKDSMIK
jgi:hypothetical protein